LLFKHLYWIITHNVIHEFSIFKYYRAISGAVLSISSSHGYKREKVTVQYVKFLLMMEALISNIYVKIFKVALFERFTPV